MYGFVMLVDAKPDRVHAVHPRVATTNIFFLKLSTYIPSTYLVGMHMYNVLKKDGEKSSINNV